MSPNGEILLAKHVSITSAHILALASASIIAPKMASRCFAHFQRSRFLRGGQSTPATAPASPARLTPVTSAASSSSSVPATPQLQPVRTVTSGENGAILEEPKQDVRFGIVKIFMTVFAGLSVGAWVSQKMAAFLEENELFVPEDDDDDDD